MLMTTYMDLSAYYFSLNRYVFLPLGFIINCVIILFALTESKKFKAFFLGQKLHIDKDIIEGKSIIEDRIQRCFHQHKIYKNPDLKLADVAHKIGIDPKVFTEFIRNEYEMSFTNFVNNFRVEEFKNQLDSPENKSFNLMGIASQSGFKSKATFYRVFKNKEGMTPKAYLKSLQSRN